MIITTIETTRKNTPDYPMSAEEAKKHFKLTDFELLEVEQYDKIIFYAG